MTATAATTQVFISYARADEDFAKALSSQLAKQGLSVWNPDDEILTGDNFWLQMGEALRKSRAMVVLVSPESMRSKNVRHEIEYALGDPNYEGRVFPVQVRPTQNIPWILHRFKSFDARQSAAKIGELIANALRQPA